MTPSELSSPLFSLSKICIQYNIIISYICIFLYIYENINILYIFEEKRRKEKGKRRDCVLVVEGGAPPRLNDEDIFGIAFIHSSLSISIPKFI